MKLRCVNCSGILTIITLQTTILLQYSDLYSNPPSSETVVKSKCFHFQFINTKLKLNNSLSRTVSQYAWSSVTGGESYCALAASLQQEDGIKEVNMQTKQL